MEQLEMHSAVRNVMRLFDRIKDYEKRVVAKRGELSEADSEALLGALSLLVQLLAPFAPHLAEELRAAFGYDDEAQMPWPGVSFEVHA
jgi:leucyl-tRNA synthetase